MNPLDITTAALGLAYIILEYRASIWMWVVGAAMQLLGIILYYQKGLYADCGMEFYYLAMTAYGLWRWKSHTSPDQDSPPALPVREGAVTCDSDTPPSSKVTAPSLSGRAGGESRTGGGSGGSLITHIPPRLALLWTAIALLLWLAIWFLLSHYTDSTVPVADAFTTALSLVGIWALAHKYLEQWLVWILVDVVTCWLYFQKDIPFKASLYGLYVIIAIAGFRRWHRQMQLQTAQCAINIQQKNAE